MRVGWGGKLIVQVLREVPVYPPGNLEPRWNDATIMELVRAMEIAKEKGIPPFGALADIDSEGPK